MARSRMPDLAILAEASDGYFTTEMAKGAGIPASVLVKMAHRGVLERHARGMYRISASSTTEYSQYWEAIMAFRASRGVSAVISHASALALRGLSDVDPTKVELTVPKSARLRRAVHPFVEVHREDLDPIDVTIFEGISVTTIPKTIDDCLSVHIEGRLLEDAIDQAVERGLLQAVQAAHLRVEVRRRAP